jgi:hypothetical protein
MAKVVETYERDDGHKIAVYESGAQYDLTAGKLIGGPPHARFNNETAVIAVERRAELKREAIMRGAAKVLERSGEWDAPNDIDVVEAISEAAMLKALNPKDAKQIDASRFILNEGGYGENQPSSNADASNIAAALGADIARSIARIVSDVMAAQPIHLHDTIDGTTKD